MPVDMLYDEDALMPAMIQAHWYSTAQLGVPHMVTIGVLQCKSLPMLRDAPGGAFVLVSAVRGVLKDGADAVVVLLQNRFGAYVLRAVNGKAAIRAVNAARSDVTAHGSQRGALNATAALCSNVPASAVPMRKPRSGDAHVLAEIGEAAMAKAVATGWLSEPPSAGGFWLPQAKLAVTGVFPGPSAVDIRRAVVREESAAVALEIEALSPGATVAARLARNTPLSVQAARFASASAAVGEAGDGSRAAAPASGPLGSWQPLLKAAACAAVSPPYREYVEPAPRVAGVEDETYAPAARVAGVEDGSSRSHTAESRSSRSSRESMRHVAALNASRMRELVKLRVHSEAAKVLAANGVDKQALSFLPVEDLLSLVSESGVAMSAVSVALLRRAVADAVSAVAPAGAPVVVDLTAAEGASAPAAAVERAAVGGAGEAAPQRVSQFADADECAAAHLGGSAPAQRSAAQIEENRQAALLRRAATAARGDAMRVLVQQVGGEVVELLAEVPSAGLPALVSSLGQMVGLRFGVTADDGHGGPVDTDILMTRVCFQLNALMQRAHLTAARALAPHDAVSGAHNRVVLAVAALASTGGEVSGSGVTTSKGYADSSSGIAEGAVRTAAANLASEPAARAALDAAHKLSEVTADGQYDSERPRLRAAMRALETGPFGDDVYTLLHQEKL